MKVFKKNIIILGSKGKLGLKIKEHLKQDNILFHDEFINIKELLNLSFLNKNKINCIINCIGSTNNEDTYFISNFYFPSFLSEKLKDLDLCLKQKLILIHISSIGIRAPYMKYNFKPIYFSPFEKLKIKYNLYELSKSCGEYNLYNNLKNTKKINTFILQPSNIIFKNSDFLKKLRFFLVIFPIKVDKNIKLAITPIDYLLNNICELIQTKCKSNIEIRKLFKRVKVNVLFKKYRYIEFFKIKIPLKILQNSIKSIPENLFLYRLKRILIFIFIL